MARLVALEWDAAEARVAIGRQRGKDLLLEHAFAVELAGRDEPQLNIDDAAVGARLAEALAPYRLGRQDVLVAVGRTSIELRRLQLPPAPDEELPDMVRFQAMRQFSTIGEQWPIDFIQLGRSESNIDVLAAAISPALVESIREACGAAELTPRHLVLRPFAAAELLKHAPGNEQRCRLLVDVLATEADLSVVMDGVVAFVRTVRLPPGDGPTPAIVQALVGEIRRTIPAAQSQLGGTRVEGITFWGDSSAHGDLLELLSEQLPLPVDAVDPFAAVRLTAEAERRLPPYRSRYAPLLGMMVRAAAEQPHEIDFLHPRQRPQPKSSRERRLLYTTAAVALICATVVGGKWYLNQKEKGILALEQEIAAAKDTVAAAQKQVSDLEQVEQFLDQKVAWLEELGHLSREMPTPKEAIVTQFVATMQRSGEGRVAVDGFVRDSELVAELESNLRTPRHRVEGSGTTRDPSRTDYPWRFSEVIFIDPKVAVAPAEAAPNETTASETAADSAANGETEPAEDSPAEAANSTSAPAAPAPAEEGAPKPAPAEPASDGEPATAGQSATPSAEVPAGVEKTPAAAPPAAQPAPSDPAEGTDDGPQAQSSDPQTSPQGQS